MLMGNHIIIECEGEHAHLSRSALESVMQRAAQVAGATVLSSHFHHFGTGLGITGVLILAESHITVHTWPEYNYAAFDIFMCGECDVEKAKIAIINGAKTNAVKSKNITRGMPLTKPTSHRIFSTYANTESTP
jgi:S-adenosylmethionine decarboxylase